LVSSKVIGFADFDARLPVDDARIAFCGRRFGTRQFEQFAIRGQCVAAARRGPRPPRMRHRDVCRKGRMPRRRLRPGCCAVQRALQSGSGQIGGCGVPVAAAVVYGDHCSAIAIQAERLGDILAHAGIPRALVDKAQRPVGSVAAQLAEALTYGFEHGIDVLEKGGRFPVQRPGRERQQRRSGDTGYPPVGQDGRAQRLVEGDGGFVPVEDRPFEPAATALHRKFRQVYQHRPAIAVAPEFGPDEQVFEIKSGAAKKSGEIMEKQGETHGFAGFAADQNFDLGTGANRCWRKSSSCATQRCDSFSNSARSRIIAMTSGTSSGFAGSIVNEADPFATAGRSGLIECRAGCHVFPSC
jgi:hypothetical protein